MSPEKSYDVDVALSVLACLAARKNIAKMSAQNTDSVVGHPYFPVDLELPHYVPNENGDFLVPAIFFCLVGVLAVLVWMYSGSPAWRLTLADRFKLCWFAVCAVIHTVLEGYFSVHHATLAGKQTYLAQIWKEYSKGDSRYMSSDNFTVCMESITAVIDGPLCFLTVLAFIRRSPYRYPLQLIVSLCQLYGCTLYFLTECRDGFIHSEKWTLQYFWFYFVFLNMLWMVIPLCLILQAVSEISKSQETSDRILSKWQGNKKRL